MSPYIWPTARYSPANSHEVWLNWDVKLCDIPKKGGKDESLPIAEMRNRSKVDGISKSCRWSRAWWKVAFKQVLTIAMCERCHRPNEDSNFYEDEDWRQKTNYVRCEGFSVFWSKWKFHLRRLEDLKNWEPFSKYLHEDWRFEDRFWKNFGMYSILLDWLCDILFLFILCSLIVSFEDSL